jgi:tetratricopeptide (TPR) repeat protein
MYKNKQSLEDVTTFFRWGTIIGCILIILYVFSANSFFKAVSALGLMGAVAGASFVLGFSVGFLFGVPRTVELNDSDSNKNLQTRIQANTNLEQISDWLTKILVGVGLTQILPILRFLKTYVIDILAPGFDLFYDGKTIDYKPSSLAISITIAVTSYFTISGFVLGYFYTVLIFSKSLKDNYELEAKIDKIQIIRQIIDVIPEVFSIDLSIYNQSKSEKAKILTWITKRINEILFRLGKEISETPLEFNSFLNEIIENIDNDEYFFFRSKDYLNLGTLLILKEDYLNALKLFDKAKDTNQYSYDAYNLMGVAYYRLKNYDLAIESFNQAKKIDRMRADAWRYIGSSIIKKIESSSNIIQDHRIQLLNESLNSLNQSIELDPFNPSTFAIKACALKLQSDVDSEEVIKAYEKALSIDPNYAFALFNMACIFTRKKETPKALEFLKRAIEVNPDLKEAAKGESAFISLKESKEFTTLIS